MLLAPFGFRGKPVIDYIDPVPVTVLGNMLGFVWHDETDKEFADWTQKHVDFARVDFDLVSVPTGGVFAEAVLGRFNSAEKLDLTRFWNWQDSPIPILPPEISAIQSGQHQPVEAPQAGRLDQPVVNIVNPPALPDPSTVAGVLSALGNGALFRDMSGLVQTVALAQAGLQAASQNALGGAAQAGTNLANVATLQGKALDAIIALASLLSGVPAVRPPGSANISTAGGAVNLGKDLDAIPQGAAGGGAGQAPNPPPVSPGGGAGGGGSPTGGGASPGSGGAVFASTGGGRAGAAFDALIGRPASANVTPTAPGSVSPAAAAPRPTTVAQAIAEFRGGSGTSPFTLDPDPVLARSQFATRLEQLAANPRSLNQLQMNACAMAAFLHIWLKNDPLAAVLYAIDLFEHGRARIGSLEIAPTQELLKQSYPALVASGGIGMPAVTDWVMMSALRNGTQLTGPRFLGTLHEEIEGIVLPHEFADWLRATGVYSTVVDKANAALQREFAVAETLVPDASRDIAMLMHTRMLTDTDIPAACRQAALDLGNALVAMAFPNHYVVLESPVEVVDGTHVRFSFWCWGDEFADPDPTKSCFPYRIRKTIFEQNFYGAVIGIK
jgi:hypothetical protein